MGAPSNWIALVDGIPDVSAMVAPLMVMVSAEDAVPLTPPLGPPSSNRVEPVETEPVVRAPEPVVFVLPTPPALSTACAQAASGAKAAPSRRTEAIAARLPRPDLRAVTRLRRCGMCGLEK